MSEATITIFGEEISVTHEKISIYKLKYFEENPRVFSCIFEGKKPTDGNDLQTVIQTKMWEEQQSVKNLIPTIKEHGGLHEHILVRHDTQQVIDGNSRLAVFRLLHEKTKDEKWATIPCNCVTSLTEEQQDAYLSQIHIRGETPWSAYEKANFAYTRHEKDVSIEDVARRSSETVKEIEKRIEIVDSMKKNNDKELSHFSYYDVLVRTKGIKDCDTDVKNFLLLKIKNMGVEGSDDGDFTALSLRKKLPVILAKKKELKKFMEEKLTLDEAYQNARPSDPRQKVRTAKDKIMDITKEEISRLEKREVDALLADINRLSKEVNRAQKMTEKVKEEKQQNA